MKEEIAVCAMVCHLLIAIQTSAANLPPGAPVYVPARLAEAIARQESGLNPWAVNVAGRDYQPANRQEAERIIIEAERAGVSYDIGLMQINRWWIRRYDIPPAELLDPETNRKWGTWILAQELARHGFNWRAVGNTIHRTPSEEDVTHGLYTGIIYPGRNMVLL